MALIPLLLSKSWWRSNFAAQAQDGSTVYPTWIMDGANQRYAEGPVGGSVSQVAFGGVIESFSRSTTKYPIGASGSPVEVAVNQPAFTYDPATLQSLGLLLEDTSTNFLLNSTAPATQTVTLTTGTFTLWVVGTGSATVAAGTAVGTNFGAATNGSQRTFQITTAGTVTVTVSGSLTRFQLEGGAYMDSFIPTAGSAVTRSVDIAQTSDISFINTASPEFTFIVDFDSVFMGDANLSGTLLSLSNGTANGQFYIKSGGSAGAGRLRTICINGGVQQVTNPNSSNSFVSGRNKVAFGFGGGQIMTALNGVSLVNTASGATAPTNFNNLRINQNVTGAERNNASYRLITCYPKLLTAAEMQRLTTL